MTGPLKIAVAGLGTVGAETLRLLEKNRDLVARRGGRAIVVTAVSARDRGRDRGVDLAPYDWYDDAAQMAAAADADVVVELIGGSDGVAKAVVEAAIAHDRHVVTANKAMLAIHGTALARVAEAAGVALAYEAAVAGGIPIVKALREGLAANRVRGVHGILNGTCNYILSRMRESGQGFAAVLAEAQSLGYAESDPSFDVDGIDAAHKLALLTSLAFGCEVDFAGVFVEGIRRVEPMDIEYADELGYRIKLLGIARETAAGIEQRVHPCLVSRRAPIAQVEGVLNAVVVSGDFVGDTVYEGQGAGAGPTASAVVADLIDVACDRRTPPFGLPSSALRQASAVPVARHRGAYYVRLMVVDRPGVIADVAAAMRDEQISLAAMLQRGRDPDEIVPVVLVSHETEEAAMRRALARIAALEASAEAPHMIRIEDL